MGLRGALKSPDADVIQAGLHALNLLVRTSEGAGLALAPYCRQLLPPLARCAGREQPDGGACRWRQPTQRKQEQGSHSRMPAGLPQQRPPPTHRPHCLTQNRAPPIHPCKPGMWTTSQT